MRNFQFIQDRIVNPALWISAAVALGLALAAMPSRAAETAPASAPATAAASRSTPPAGPVEPQRVAVKGRTIDLGQLEIEGELRRPQVDWIDSSKRVKDWLPRIHSAEFQRLEGELTKPVSVEEARKRSGVLMSSIWGGDLC